MAEGRKLNVVSLRMPALLAACLFVGTVPLACLPSCPRDWDDGDDPEDPTPPIEVPNLPPATLARILPPAAGTLYHGTFPGGDVGEEDEITAANIQSYIDTVGKNVVWVYFSHNWFKSRAFPQTTATLARAADAVPFIRLMLRSSEEQDTAEPFYTLDAIISGQFDADLAAWGRAARDFAAPLLVEWGTECNGEWFSWNGVWNGKGKTNGFGDPAKADGPERFVAAYRHIVAQIRAAGAVNATFVWHANNEDWPDVSWNRLENYYPGDDVVDWLAVSVYGPQSPIDEDVPQFTASLDAVYPRLAALNAQKPIIVAEVGCCANHPDVTAANWANGALTSLFSGRWPRIIGLTWWNEQWRNDRNPAHDTTMRVQDIPALANVFRTQFTANSAKLATTAVTQDLE